MKVYFYLLMTIILLLGCSSGTHPEDTDFILPDSNLVYARDIYPMFDAKCGFESGCHSPTDNRDQGLSYGDISNVEMLVAYRLSQTDEKLVNRLLHSHQTLTIAETAPLYIILNSGYLNAGVERMPPASLGKKRLTDNQLKGIRQWILEGAR